jgi:hypothetical protein
MLSLLFPGVYPALAVGHRIAAVCYSLSMGGPLVRLSAAWSAETRIPFAEASHSSFILQMCIEPCFLTKAGCGSKDTAVTRQILSCPIEPTA